MAFDDYKIPTRSMTSEEVFAALVDLHRDAAEGLPLLADASREDPVFFLFDTYDVGGWRTVAESLNELFAIHVTLDVWRSVLLPKRKQTLGGVCDLIARHATVPVIEPITVMGDHSLSAGAFLVLRRVFADVGIDVSELRPSSPLRPYLREHIGKVRPALVRMAPFGLPPPSIDAPVDSVIAWLLLAGLCTLSAGLCCHLPPVVTVASGAITTLSFLALWICGLTVKPADVRFGDARTFADLARILAGERSAFCGFPVITR